MSTIDASARAAREAAARAAAARKAAAAKAAAEKAAKAAADKAAKAEQLRQGRDAFSVKPNSGQNRLRLDGGTAGEPRQEKTAATHDGVKTLGATLKDRPTGTPDAAAIAPGVRMLGASLKESLRSLGGATTGNGTESGAVHARNVRDAGVTPEVAPTSDADEIAAEDGLPQKAEDLAEQYPTLKDRPKAELEKAYDSLKKLKEGDPSEQLTALGELAENFPEVTDSAIEKLGLKDNPIAEIASDPDALSSLGTLVDEEASALEKAEAALTLAHTVGSELAPEDVEGFLKTSLAALPAGAELASSISTFMDPEASGLDKAGAALDLAKALKDFTGEAFPELANSLRKLDSSFKSVDAALTLLDPDASVKDRAQALATLATELPDVKNDLQAFRELLREHGVKNVDDVFGEAALEATVKGLDPELAASMSPEDLETLAAIAETVGKDELADVLEGIDDRKALGALTRQLDGMEGDAGKRMLKALSGLEHGVLAETLNDPKVLGQMGELATKLDDAAMETVGKLVKEMDADMLRTLLKYTDGVSPEILEGTIKGLAPVLGEVDGKLVGKILKALDGVIGGLGLEVTADVAGKVFKNLLKIIPFAGAVPGVIDAARLGAEAAELRDKNPDLAFFAQLGANLNGADAVVGTILSFTGVGAAVDLGVGALFGVAELAHELAFDAEKAKYEADPEGYEAPDWMKAINLAGAAAMGPAGVAQLAAIYGPEGAAELAQWGIEKGAEGAIAVAEFAGVSSAQLAEDGLKGAAGFIRLMADVLRDPGKYGEAIAQAAAEHFNKALEIGGAIADAAREQLTDLVNGAIELGEKGLETLRFIAENPGEAAKIAVEGLQNLIDSGIDLATEAGKALYQGAVETLNTLREGWENLTGAARELADDLISTVDTVITDAVNKAIELGEQGVELLVWAAQNPGAAAEAAKEAISDVLAKGGELAQQTWDTIRDLGEQGLELAGDVIEGLKDLGGKAVDTLRYIAENPGEAAAQVRDWVGNTLSDIARKGGEIATEAAEAIVEWVDNRVEWAQEFAVELLKDGVEAFNEVVSAWSEALTEGGREVLLALEDLGAAGVEALNNLAELGGEVAEAAVEKLSNLVDMGVDAAKAALEGLADLGGEIGRIADETLNALKEATNGEISLGPIKVDVNPLW